MGANAVTIAVGAATVVIGHVLGKQRRRKRHLGLDDRELACRNRLLEFTIVCFVAVSLLLFEFLLLFELHAVITHVLVRIVAILLFELHAVTHVLVRIVATL